MEGAAGTAQEYEEIIAYHLEQAYRYRGELGPIGEPERAVAVRAARLLAGAGRRAAARGDMPGEANLLERAVALFPQWDAERLEAVLDESDALWALGEFRKEETLLLDAVGHARALGDAALEMRLRIQATLVKNATDPDAFVVEADDLHRDAVALFERLGDDRGLAAAWELAALRLNMVGHPAAMEDADARAIQHWHRAGDRRQELTAMSRAAGTFFWGRTPVDQGIRRIEEMLEQVKGHPVVEARMHRALSGFLAMQGRFDEARNLLHQAKATCEEFGAKVMLASMSFFTGPLELLAGDPAAAERDLRASCDALEAMGERGWYCSLAGLLAEALYQQGRYDEAYEWTVRSERAGGKWDLEAQADVRAVRAKILARRGDLQAAERLAREAVEIATGTGEIDHEGDAWFDLAEVLTLAGRQEEAAGALREAIERWDGKGNVVSAARARARLTELASRE